VTTWVGGAGPTPATQVTLRAVHPSPATEFTRALYTALLAPIVLGVLQRLKGVFGFQAGKRKNSNYFARKEG
jgi:hypothetical protein